MIDQSNFKVRYMHDKVCVLVLFTFLVGCAVAPETLRLKDPKVDDFLSFPAEVQFTSQIKKQEGVSAIRSWKGWAEELLKDDKGNNILMGINQALKNNQQLKQAESNLRKFQATLDAANKLYLPSVSLSIARDDEKKKVRNWKTKTDYRANLGVSWELDLFGKFQDNAKAVSFSVLSQEAQLDFLKRTVVAQYIRQWVNVNILQQKQVLLEKSIQLLQKKRNTIYARYAKGFEGSDAVMLLNQEWETQQIALRALQENQQKALRAMEALLGVYPGARMKVRGGLPNSLPAINAVQPASLLMNRPDLQVSYYALHTKRSEVASAIKKRWLPSVTLSLQGSSTKDTLENIFQLPSIWSMSLKLIENLFSPVQSLNVTLAKEDEVQALVQFSSTMLSAFQEAEERLALAEKTQQDNAAFQKGVAIAFNRFELTNARYQRGLIGVEKWLDSYRLHIQAKQSLLDGRGSHIHAWIDALQAMGFHVETPNS